MSRVPIGWRDCVAASDWCWEPAESSNVPGMRGEMTKLNIEGLTVDSRLAGTRKFSLITHLKILTCLNIHCV